MAISVNVTETVIDTDVTNTDVTVALTEQTTNVELTYPGPQGASAIVNVTTPITNTGTTTEPNIGIDQTLLSLARTQIVGTAVTEAAGKALTAGTADYATTAGSATTASTALTAGTASYATNAGDSLTAGTSVYAANAGTAVNISGTIAPTQVTGTALTISNYRALRNFPANTIENVDRTFATGTTGALTNGRVHFSFFSPDADITISQIAAYVATGTTDTGGTTVRRMGIYTISGSTVTLVARTASDSTLFNTSTSIATRSLDTTGGYPSTYTLTAGTRYAVGIICYNTGGTYAGPSLGMTATGLSALTGTSPLICQLLGSQTDLPTSSSSTSNSTLNVWVRLS